MQVFSTFTPPCLDFLRASTPTSSSSAKDSETAKKTLLETLGTCLKSLLLSTASSPRAHQLSLSCLSCCLAVSRHSKESAAVRVQALSGPLTALLPFFNRRPNDPAVDIVNSLFKPLLQEYQASVTKLPSSVKSALFLVLGKCIQTHPKPFLLQQDGISLRQTLSRYTADEVQ